MSKTLFSSAHPVPHVPLPDHAVPHVGRSSGYPSSAANPPDTHRRALLRLSVACLPAAAILSACAEPSDSSYRQRLYTPTLITKLGDRYFIVDCWHHRIIHSTRLDVPVGRWQILDDDLAGPHSIATDGELYVTEDTGRHALKVYREDRKGHFHCLQTLADIGQRPHRTLYDPDHDQFLVIGSGDQHLYFLQKENGELKRRSKAHIPGLGTQYCRSITHHQGLLYFVGVNDIISHPLNDLGLDPMHTHLPLHEHYQGANDLYYLDDTSGILTCTPGKAFFFDRVEQLQEGTATELSAHFQGTPYYLSAFDGQLWIPEITEYSAIRSYSLPLPSLPGSRAPDLSTPRRRLNYGAPDQHSLARKDQLPR